MWSVELNKIQLLGKLIIVILSILGVLGLGFLLVILAVKYPQAINVQLVAIISSIVTVFGTLLGVMGHSLFDKTNPSTSGVSNVPSTTINASSGTVVNHTTGGGSPSA